MINAFYTFILDSISSNIYSIWICTARTDRQTSWLTILIRENVFRRLTDWVSSGENDLGTSTVSCRDVYTTDIRRLETDGTMLCKYFDRWEYTKQHQITIHTYGAAHALPLRHNIIRAVHAVHAVHTERASNNIHRRRSTFCICICDALVNTISWWWTINTNRFFGSSFALLKIDDFGSWRVHRIRNLFGSNSLSSLVELEKQKIIENPICCIGLNPESMASNIDWFRNFSIPYDYLSENRCIHHLCAFLQVFRYEKEHFRFSFLFAISPFLLYTSVHVYVVRKVKFDRRVC